MKHIWSRRSLAFFLCAALLVTICGCRKKNPFSDLPLDNESVISLETMWGKSFSELEEEWDFSLEDLVEEVTGSGRWSLERKMKVGGKDFWQSLLVAKNNMLSGFVFRCYCDSAEEVAEIAEMLYLAAVEEYGKAKHGHLTSPNFLDNEGVFDEIKKSREGGWDIAWAVGEFSYLSMQVGIRGDEKSFIIELKYSVLPEEWHRFDPEYKSSVSLGPTLRSDGLD